MRHLIALSVCTALWFFGAGSSAQAKAVCNSPAEVSAVQVRQLQIEMMVSTLRCDSSTYDFHSHYSSFINRVNPLLPDNVKRLKAMVGRTGKGGFDQYLTSMSNDAQNLSQQDPLYCGNAVQILNKVAEMESKDVPAFAAQTIPSPYQVTACPEAPAKEKTKSKAKPNAHKAG